MFKRLRARRRAEKAAQQAARQGDTQALIDLLGQPDPKIRASAANACMLLPAGSAPPSLVGSLLRAGADPDAKVRYHTILALGSLRASEASDLFLRALSDDDRWVRMAAAVAIGWMPDPRAVGVLRQLLSDEEPFVRQFAALALGEIGDETSLPAIQALLRTEQDAEVRKWAQEALDKLSNPS